jgi:hypothetical protein
MRNLAVLLVTLVLAGCNKTPVKSNQTQSVSPTVVEFLLTSAATDFHTHRPPDPVRFREVRIGHFKAPAGEEHYMMCGQFLQAQQDGKAQWTPFTTIKTSGYEQYIGGQAAGFSKDSSVIWDDVDDLSSALQSKLDSLRTGTG